MIVPQERKSQQSLFWFGLGINIFVGNTVAITQQALWGRALDYMAVGGGRPIRYGEVVRQGFATEGFAAFYTPVRADCVPSRLCILRRLYRLRRRHRLRRLRHPVARRVHCGSCLSLPLASQSGLRAC